MTPADFQTVALAWISALVVIVIALLAAYAKIAPMIVGLKAELKSDHALTAQQTDQNTARLNGQSAKIDALLRTSPGPEAAGSTTVNAPAADVVNIAPAADAPASTVTSPTVAPVGFPGIAPTPAPANVNKSTVIEAVPVAPALPASDAPEPLPDIITDTSTAAAPKDAPNAEETVSAKGKPDAV